MTRIPRDISGNALVKALERYGYQPVRQTGSHIRLTTEQGGISHHLTVPNHKALRLGTLSSIVGDVAQNFNLSKEQVIEKLFG